MAKGGRKQILNKRNNLVKISSTHYGAPIVGNQDTQLIDVINYMVDLNIKSIEKGK